MTHAELREMLGLYALGALEAHDAAALAAHLEKCPSCLAELVNLEESVAELAHAAGPIPPPADVTSRILRAARSEPPLAALSPARTARPRRRRAPGRWRRRLGAAAGVAVAAGVVLLVVSQITDSTARSTRWCVAGTCSGSSPRRTSRPRRSPRPSPRPAPGPSSPMSATPDGSSSSPSTSHRPPSTRSTSSG